MSPIRAVALFFHSNSFAANEARKSGAGEAFRVLPEPSGYGLVLCGGWDFGGGGISLEFKEAAGAGDKGKLRMFAREPSDLPVLEEARLTAEMTGDEVEQIADAGVAGIQRLRGQAREVVSGPCSDCRRGHGRRCRVWWAGWLAVR